MNGKTFLAVLVIVLGVAMFYTGITGRTTDVIRAIQS